MKHSLRFKNKKTTNFLYINIKKIYKAILCPFA